MPLERRKGLFRLNAHPISVQDEWGKQVGRRPHGVFGWEGVKQRPMGKSFRSEFIGMIEMPLIPPQPGHARIKKAAGSKFRGRNGRETAGKPSSLFFSFR